MSIKHNFVSSIKFHLFLLGATWFQLTYPHEFPVDSHSMPARLLNAQEEVGLAVTSSMTAATIPRNQAALTNFRKAGSMIVFGTPDKAHQLRVTFTDVESADGKQLVSVKYTVMVTSEQALNLKDTMATDADEIAQIMKDTVPEIQDVDTESVVELADKLDGIVAQAIKDAGFTAKPTPLPTVLPTAVPTVEPSLSPTAIPTVLPTAHPTASPTASPTETPTETPTTSAPTAAPTPEPTDTPTEVPTEPPTDQPTETPTEAPTESPTAPPTEPPTVPPTDAPTEGPTPTPATATPPPTPPITDNATDNATADEDEQDGVLHLTMAWSATCTVVFALFA